MVKQFPTKSEEIEKTNKTSPSGYEQIIKEQLELWIDDAYKEAKLNRKLENAFKRDKSHIQSLSQM